MCFGGLLMENLLKNLGRDSKKIFADHILNFQIKELKEHM